MTNRKSTQENIQRISLQITEFNADLMTKNPLALLDIDLLRKYTIDLYDEVNQLRLVMKDKIEVEVERNDHNQVQAPETLNPIPETRDLEDLAKAETEVEAEAEVEAMVEAMVEEELPNEESKNPEPLPAEAVAKEGETLNPLPAEAVAKEGEIKLAAAEAKAEADAIKAALNPEEANDLAFKFSNTPIHDLKKAISIAKKFEFINSLFGGNVEKYAYSIHHLNNLNNGDEAFAYLHELRSEWKWDDEDSNFQELANLIRRRFLG